MPGLDEAGVTEVMFQPSSALPHLADARQALEARSEDPSPFPVPKASSADGARIAAFVQRSRTASRQAGRSGATLLVVHQAFLRGETPRQAVGSRAQGHLPAEVAWAEEFVPELADRVMHNALDKFLAWYRLEGESFRVYATVEDLRRDAVHAHRPDAETPDGAIAAEAPVPVQGHVVPAPPPSAVRAVAAAPTGGAAALGRAAAPRG